MILEDQRFIHEDIERLEQGISDRLLDDPKNVSTRRFHVLRPAANSWHRSKIA